MQRGASFRERLNDAAGWVMVGAGLVAVVVITALMTSIESALGAGVMFLGLLAGGFLSTAVHELGHAAAAWLVGWRVWIISVAGALVRRGHGLRLTTKYSHDVGGYVLASPESEAHDSRWRSIAVSAGGPLASVLSGPLVILWLIELPPGTWPETPLASGVLVGVLAFGAASSSAALATLWPWRGRDGRPNDMRMILDAAFVREPSTDVRGVSWAWGLFEYGVEPESWPSWMHVSIAKSAGNPWASPAAPLLAFLCALQGGDETAARETARRCAHSIGKLMRAYVHAYFDSDAPRAQSELKGVELNPREEALVLLRDFVNARIAALNGDTQTAAQIFAAIADDVNSDAPKPFWSRLLERAAA